jgi:hypothetical protein
MSKNDELPELPDDVADAWAAVLIDIYEKMKQEESDSADTEQDAGDG